MSLRELVDTQPLEQGLAELVAYLQLGSESFRTVVDEQTRDSIHWQLRDADNGIVHRQAELPRVLFVR